MRELTPTEASTVLAIMLTAFAIGAAIWVILKGVKWPVYYRPTDIHFRQSPYTCVSWGCFKPASKKDCYCQEHRKAFKVSESLKRTVLARRKVISTITHIKRKTVSRGTKKRK